MTVVSLILLGLLGLVVILRALAPTVPVEDGGADDGTDEQRPDSGADENWSPLEEVARADSLATDQPAPDWDTHHWLVDVHGELNALEDAFHADVEHFWGWVYDQLQIDARYQMRLPSSIEHTGAYDLVELESLLAVA